LDNEAFTYDAVGNRLTSSDTTGLWTYNDNNELNAHNDTSYEYDDNGNMIKKTDHGAVTNYIYDIEDRLTEVRDGQGSLIASYYYDPFGRRLWKEVDGVRTYFLYSDEGLIGEYDASGAEIKTYGYKPGSTWTTDPLFMKMGSEYYFYQNDHIGSPQKMTAINGAIVWSTKYESFGKADVDINSTITNPLRFPGQYEDQEIELHYNHYRYYEASIGRYLRTDQVGIKKGENHLYIYALNNPIIFIDPFGLEHIISFYENYIGTYGASVMVVDTCTDEIVFTGKGSTLPNDRVTQNTVASGTYTGIKTKMATSGRVALFIGTTPTAPGSPSTVASQIFVHCGTSRTNRGSRGCLTISRGSCAIFFKIFDENESVKIMIIRV